jgi:hypothetical protein
MCHLFLLYPQPWAGIMLPNAVCKCHKAKVQLISISCIPIMLLSYAYAIYILYTYLLGA